jgi:PEP-CTERM motif
MKKLLLGIGTTLAVLLVAAGQHARAAAVYATAADLTGSRNSGLGGGLVPGGDWASDGDTETISWSIVNNGNGTWNYTYTLANFSKPGISHFLLDLTDDAVFPTVDPQVVTSVSPANYELFFDNFVPGGMGNSNVGLPAPIIGVKIQFTGGGSFPSAVSFTSNRAPVWGDFYVKGGKDSFVYNAGLVNHASDNKGIFLARPDGAVSVPEPTSIAMVAMAGVAGLGLARRRRAK